MIWLFNRHEDKVYTTVGGLPNLSPEQITVFKNLLDKANHNSDRWYMAKLEAVDFLFSGKAVNLLDLDRLYRAASWQDMFDKNPANKDVFDEICRVLWPKIEELDKRVKEIKFQNKIISEQDIVGRQIKISWLSAISAIASAVAAGASAYIAYMQSIQNIN